jgi:LuxR family maltose regulon positive regulatory protein
VVEALVVRALVRHARGVGDGAVGDLERALGLGTPVGYRRLFLDEGEPVLELLRLAARPGAPAAAAAAELLRAAEGPVPPPLRPAAAHEAMSERELEVLRLLATELTGPEIARQLFVSINTFRTHTKSIFMKLGVNTRRAAVAAAAERGLL